MGWTFIAAESAAADGSGTTLDCGGALNVAAGDLLVGVAKWDGTDAGSNSIAATSGNGNTFTLESVQQVTKITTVVGYKLVADANPTATFRLTLGDGRIYRSICILQFRPDGGKTTTLDDGPNPATDTANQPVSGTISPCGTDLVVVGTVGVYDYSFHTPEIDDVGADGSELINTFAGIWYKIFTESQSNIAADITWTGPVEEWVCDILGFKSAAAPAGYICPSPTPYENL